MKNHYVTFGQVHTHSINGKTLDKDTVAVFKAKDAQEGRRKAFEMFGSKFCFEYSEKYWKESYLRSFTKGYVKID